MLPSARALAARLPAVGPANRISQTVVARATPACNSLGSAGLTAASGVSVVAPARAQSTAIVLPARKGNGKRKSPPKPIIRARDRKPVVETRDEATGLPVTQKIPLETRYYKVVDKFKVRL